VAALQSIAIHLTQLVAAVSVKPNPKGLPGTSALEKLLDGVAALALLACVGAILLGAAQWSLGNRSHNYSQAADGKARMLYGVIGAFAVGAAAAVINFFYNAGAAAH
jgi:hypothetical protein